MNAEINWLQRKWGLPPEAVPAVRELLRAEAQGSTAAELCDRVSAWGAAALPCDEPGSSPVVIVGEDGRSFLQSRALFEAERGVARHLLSLARREPAPLPGIEDQLSQLFPGAEAANRQVEAARVASTRGLTLVTGGPGTGKTYTLARILVLIAANGVAPERIRLAAPTGKAAQRMKAAVQGSLRELPVDFRKWSEALDHVAEGCSTLHTLLQYHPGLRRCRCERLPAGTVLIVDECSMVDVHMWSTLLRAMPDDGRLVLLGDPNQLESVGQGNVFAGLARAAGTGPLREVRVHLTEARRFRDRPDILALATALEASDADAVEALLRSCAGGEADKGLAWIDTPAGILPCERFPQRVMDALLEVAQAPSPREALDALGKVCILTAQRDAFVGAQRVGQDIERFLLSQTTVLNHPVIINRNDPETRLRNGQVGVVGIGAEGRRQASFLEADGSSLSSFPVMKLPEHNPAWAITIHRSQGSEYDEVLVILPRADSPLATQELLYTAITRARRNVYVAGDLASIRKAVLTPSSRQTLLPYQLRRV